MTWPIGPRGYRHRDRRPTPPRSWSFTDLSAGRGLASARVRPRPPPADLERCAVSPDQPDPRRPRPVPAIQRGLPRPADERIRPGGRSRPSITAVYGLADHRVLEIDDEIVACGGPVGSGSRPVGEIWERGHRGQPSRGSWSTRRRLLDFGFAMPARSQAMAELLGHHLAAESCHARAALACSRRSQFLPEVVDALVRARSRRVDLRSVAHVVPVHLARSSASRPMITPAIHRPGVLVVPADEPVGSTRTGR